MNFYIMFIKSVFTNLCIAYTFVKIKNIKKIENKKIFMIVFFNICLGIIYSIIYGMAFKYKNTAVPNVILYNVYAIIVLAILNNKKTDEFNLIVFPIAMALASKFIAGIISFFILKLGIVNNEIVEYIILGVVQILLVYLFFRIRRFRNGFSFLNMNNKKTIKIGIIICLILIIFAILIGKNTEDTMIDTICTIIIISGGIAMFDWIKKSITKYYKEKMKERTVEIQQEQIKQQDEKIKNLQTELADVLQINHKYSHRISAMEKAVTKLGTKIQANEEFA